MIQVKTIDGVLLRDMFIAGAALLEKNREVVDALNVFPVPDGDTGTNMSLTMASAVREINQKEYLNAGDCAAAMSKGALRGARGNSGVITSQLYRGFAKAIAGVEKITPVDFAAALKRGAETAYKAVMKPKEGTILTVARVIAEEAVKQTEKAPEDFDALFENILTTGEKILKMTQQMLPALTQAGVVDAGGRGLLLIYKGYVATLRGEEAPDTTEENEADSTTDAEQLPPEEATKYGYSTEFEIRNMFSDIVPEDIDSFRRRLNRIGDGVAVEGDLNAVTVHVYTDEPGKALEYGQTIGELQNINITNLIQIRREKAAAAQPVVEENKEPSKEYGMVSVSIGDGFDAIFTELGVDSIVQGGQTMNPSIDDILEAVKKADAKTVFVLPNNGNVILAAQQAAQVSENAKVVVIPTKNVAMGIAAAITFNPDASAEENAAQMEEAAQAVRTGSVTYAVRDTDLDDMHIKQGDIIGLYNGKIQTVGSDIYEVTRELVKNIVTEDDAVITVYYGKDTPETEAQRLADEFAATYSFCDVSAQKGGQPLYYYLVSVE